MQNNTQKRRRYQKDLAPTDEIITLIQLVRQNPALYNYKLQPNQRRRTDILNGWAHIASVIGGKYSVEECRRKWKNLRDTYHQYRLRKSKIGDGLSKWRYAKNMEFLSNVYQPKLKSNRTQNYSTQQDTLLHSVAESGDDQDQVVHREMVHSSIISVNDTDTFILTSYEDVTHDNDVSHEDPNMVSHSELHDDNNSMHDCVEIVKHEQPNSLDEDGNTGAEVDYEEVCLYEEAGNAPSVDCETIIGGPPGSNSPHSADAKFQYLDATDFCIASINASRTQYANGPNSVMTATGPIKLKTLPMVTSTTTAMSPTATTQVLEAPVVSIAPATEQIQTLPELTPSCVTSSLATITSPSASIKTDPNGLLVSASTSAGQPALIHPPTYANNTATVTSQSANNLVHNNSATCCNHQREECDLFFDFLKKKMQRFPPEEITSIQVELLNCVLRLEAEQAHKSRNPNSV